MNNLRQNPSAVKGNKFCFLVLFFGRWKAAVCELLLEVPEDVW